MNNNYYNLYGDYTGATGSYSINDYIDITSNILEINSSNYTNITSNILKNYTNTNITNLDNKYKILIKEETEDNLINTYITNSNIQGQIKFITRFDTNDYRYKTRIKENGEIEVYYPDYNPIYPTMFVGWYNVMGSIRDAYNYQNIATELIGGSYIAINDIYKKYYGLVAATGASFSAITGQQLTKERFAEIVIASSKAVKYNKFSQTQAILGITGLGVAGIAASLFNGVAYDTSVRNVLYDLSNLDLIVYSNITQTEKETATTNLINDANLNIIETNNNFSNLALFNGFINCNIQIPQTIPSLNTSNINISINYNVGFPTIGINGGSGDKIILKYGSELNYPLSIGNDTNNLWLSTNNDINFYNKGVKTASITSAGDLLVSGDIMVNNKLLSDTYANNDQIYTYSNVYSVEREYPPKAYNYTSLEDIETILSQLSFHQNFYLDETGINYGSGYYEIFSSSKYDNQTTKDILFNFSTQSSFYASWGISIYNGATGNYSGDDTLDGQYYGDWIILKIPNNIILNRFRFYPRIDFIGKAPAEFKCYGSIDGLIFTEIIEAQQLTRLTTANYSLGYYEKTLNTSFNTEYNYIGFTFGKIVSTGFTDLNMAEIKLYGKEIIDKIIVDDVYTKPEKVKDVILNDTPQVCKHNAFYCQTSTVIFPNNGSTPYYKYDIDMRNYTQTGYIQIGSQSNDPYRIFRIRAFLGSCYFSSIKNGLPDILNYEIYMSFKANAASGGQGAAGVNIYAIGYPNNPTLNITPPNNIFILASPFNDFNYITLVSTSPADIRVIIEDLIS
jgi:hypothetical protein